MKKLRGSNSGITLIALVITIIVLLILAGISIATLMGENGILTRASNADEKTIHGTIYEGVLLKVGDYRIEKQLARTSADVMEYLKNKNIIDDDSIIDAKELVGQNFKLGNGNVSDGDYYAILEEVDEEENKNYKVVYYGEANTVEWEKELITIKGENSSATILADVVKVGDYVNYAPTYSNALTVKEGIGTGWRVAYVDNNTGVVTLVSEGVPLYTKLNNPWDGNCSEIEFDYDSINELFDNTVGTDINIFDLEDVQALSTQAGFTVSYTEPKLNWNNEEYKISSDDLYIIDIGQLYLLNTISADQYGKQHYLYFDYSQYNDVNDSFVNDDYYVDVGVRLTIDLKPGLNCYGGSGTSGDPYKIY